MHITESEDKIMKKVLVYVDAENICKEEAREALRNVKSNLKDDEMMVGKFYGACQSITSVMQVCYEEGLEYVETSSINHGSKNVTDMKICLDCTWDVLTVYEKCVSRVIILTKDCDFVPLVYKLKGSNVEVETPLFNPEERCKTPADVSVALENEGFDPMALGSRALKNQYCTIRALLPAKFSDGVIETYLDRKQHNFLKGVKALFDKETYDKLCSEKSREFSLYSVIPFVKQENLMSVIDCYTTKYYGISFSKKDCSEILAVVQSEAETL